MLNIIIILLFTKSVDLQKQPRSQQQSNNNGITCKLPQHPDNGRWTLSKGEWAPGDEIPANTILQFECNPGYKLNKDAFLPCYSEWRPSDIPQCEKLCPGIRSTPTTKVKCINNMGLEINCDEATDGSRLTYDCIPYYEPPDGYRKTIHCLDGIWTYPKPFCQPVCGRKIEKDSIPLISGGTIKTPREYPWIVAIYHYKKDKGWRNICGGSILSPKVVITAAHCVASEVGDALPEGDFKLGAGKYYNRMDDGRDKDAQYTEVARIIVHPDYKGHSRSYIADLALVISKQLFTLNSAVQPICYAGMDEILLLPNDVGVVSGWGIKEDGDVSDELRTLEIPYRDPYICQMELPKQFSKKFGLQDKLCVGFVNQSKSVCQGDSGSGLAFKNSGDSRYYIHGIVSLSPHPKNISSLCDRQQNALYTSIKRYYDFIDEIVIKQSDTQRCVLPEYPRNGRWVIKEDSKKKPGDIVPPNTVLKFECNGGFKLSSNNVYVQCESIYRLPTCEALCPKFELPIGTNLDCKNRNGEEVNCIEATEGSSLSYTCPKSYKPPADYYGVTHCKFGSWEPKPECQVENVEATLRVPRSVDGDPRVICRYEITELASDVYPEDLNANRCTDVLILSDFTDIDKEVKNGLYGRVNGIKRVNPDLTVLLNVGGATINSPLLSTIAADDSKVQQFLEKMWDFMNTHNFDGFNIEWIYPKKSERDTYVNLLREVRKKFPRGEWLITASVSVDPSSKGYNTDVMNELLDWVNIETTDMYEVKNSKTGKNSASSSSSIEIDKNQFQYDSAINWLAAGLDKGKIALTIAFEGRKFTLKNENLHEFHNPLPDLDYICQNTIGKWDEQKNKDKWLGHDNQESVSKAKSSYAKENDGNGSPLSRDDFHGKCDVKQILLKHVRRKLEQPITWAKNLLDSSIPGTKKAT